MHFVAPALVLLVGFSFTLLSQSDGFVALFNGKNLEGWTVLNVENPQRSAAPGSQAAPATIKPINTP